MIAVHRLNNVSPRENERTVLIIGLAVGEDRDAWQLNLELWPWVNAWWLAHQLRSLGSGVGTL